MRIVDSFGKPKAAYSFSEFGSMKEKRGSYAQPFGYTGYQYDDTASLYFAQARYYDPTLGRFVSEDKVKGNIIRPDTINPYIYCLSNPLRYVDFDGNSNEDTINGTAAHSALQKRFMEIYGSNGGHVEYKVQNYSGSDTGVGRIDIALEASEGWEVYEIKPISCHQTGAGKDQRQNYINALKVGGDKISNNLTFNPNYFDLPSNKKGKCFRYYTFADSPGMIYWGYVNEK